MINAILKDEIIKTCVLLYMDDVLVYSTILDEPINLKRIIRSFRDYNLKIQPNKCDVLKQKTEVLGHIVTIRGISPNPKKKIINAILEMPLPKNHKEIKSFLGMVGLYRKFINNLANI